MNRAPDLGQLIWINAPRDWGSSLWANYGTGLVNTKRTFLAGAGAVLVLGMLPVVGAEPALPLVTIYKNPACGCCGEWVKHMRAGGFRVEVRETGDLAPIRRKAGVPDALASCHTAFVGGYAIEGHVPAADVKRLLRERTKAIGLAVPGMVAGSPGMEQGPAQPYSTIAFGERGSTVFARH